MNLDFRSIVTANSVLKITFYPFTIFIMAKRIARRATSFKGDPPPPPPPPPPPALYPPPSDFGGLAVEPAEDVLVALWLAVARLSFKLCLSSRKFRCLMLACSLSKLSRLAPIMRLSILRLRSLVRRDRILQWAPTPEYVS